MSELAVCAHAFLAVVRRDLYVFASYRTRVVTQLASALFSLTLFYYVSRLVRVHGFGSPGDYYAFVVIGLALLSLIYACFTAPGLVRQELVSGTMDRLVLSPFGAVRGIVAAMVFPLLYAIFTAAFSLALACVAFGLHLRWATVPAAIPVLALALLAFVPFGLVFAAVTVVVKQDNVGTSWVIAILSLIGGLYFPISLLPGWAQTAGRLQPFTPATSLLRHLLVGTPMSGSAGLALVKLGAFALLLLPASIFALSAGVRVAQRRGTIIEY